MDHKKSLRLLLGEYYSSLEDFKEKKTNFQLNKTFKFPVKIKKNFKPFVKEVKTSFYTCLNNPLVYFSPEVSRFFFDEYNSSDWYSFRCFYYFQDKVQVSFYSSNNKLLGTDTFIIDKGEASRFKSYPEEHEFGFLEITLLERNLNNKIDFEKKINQLKESIKSSISTNLLPLAFKRTKKENRGINLKYKINENSSANIIKFLKHLKLDLSPEEPLSVWQQKFNNLEINWGFKDFYEYKALSQYWNNVESSIKVAIGQTNIKHVIKSIENSSEEFRQNLQSVIEFLENYQKE